MLRVSGPCGRPHDCFAQLKASHFMILPSLQALYRFLFLRSCLAALSMLEASEIIFNAYTHK